MSTHELHALARIKLDELRRQRTALSERYRALEEQSRDASQPLLARLDALLRGLGALRFAQTTLHADVAVIDAQLAVLRLEAALGNADEELLERALERARVELLRGRTRVEFAQLFGELIEEHLAVLAAGASGRAPEARLLDLVTSAPAEASAVAPWFARVFERHGFAMTHLRHSLAEQERWGPLVSQPVTPVARAMLAYAAAGPLRSAGVRAAALDALGSEAHAGEYGDVLTIMLERLEDWRWPEAGVALRAEWDHGKCRLTADERLLDLLFTEHVGFQVAKRLARWRRAAGLPAGDPHKALFRVPQAPTAPTDADADGLSEFYRRSGAHALDVALAEHSNEFALALLQEDVPGYDASSNLNALEEPTRQQALLATLQGQLDARRALDPTRPLWVLQFDIADFFPSIPHEAVLAAVELLGFHPRWQRFIARYLALPVAEGAGAGSLRRGLLAGRALPWVLAELLVLPLESEVDHATGLRLLRVVDDVFVVSEDLARLRAVWAIAQAWARDFGLRIHAGKSGLVRLEPLSGAAQGAPSDGAPPDEQGELPASLPRWGALRLHPDGCWRQDESRIEALRAWTREQLTGARSVMELVARYNTEVVYLLRSLAVTTDLHPTHLDAVADVVARFHHDLFGAGAGVREALVRRARGRLLAGFSGRDELPSPLLYWPVTAGGLGLTQPMILLHALRAHFGPGGRAAASHTSDAESEVLWAFGRARAQAPRRPKSDALERIARQLRRAASEGRDAEEVAQRVGGAVQPLVESARQWPEFAKQRAASVPVTPPVPSPALEALTRDFIERGTELGGRVQKGLSPYWRWVLHTYGPALLDVVGSFRFLLTELVPLPLLLGNRAVAPKPGTSDDVGSSAEERAPESEDIPF